MILDKRRGDWYVRNAEFSFFFLFILVTFQKSTGISHLVWCVFDGMKGGSDREFFDRKGWQKTISQNDK